MKPKPTKPTAKLPRARVMFTEADYSAFNAHGCNPVAVLPCHTAAQARAICKAAPFLRMTAKQKEQEIGMAIINSWADGSFQDVARAVLRAMGLGGGK